MKYMLSFTLNGVPTDAVVKPTETLLDVIREDKHVHSPKRGCDTGDCGACNVLIDGKLFRACLVLALTVEGKSVSTVEGLAVNGKLHPIQQALVDTTAVQCGFCTPGMIMAAKALLDENPAPTRTDIVNYMNGNLCRCGCYEEIVQSIELAADTLRKEK